MHNSAHVNLYTTEIILYRHTGVKRPFISVCKISRFMRIKCERNNPWDHRPCIYVAIHLSSIVSKVSFIYMEEVTPKILLFQRPMCIHINYFLTDEHAQTSVSVQKKSTSFIIVKFLRILMFYYRKPQKPQKYCTAFWTNIELPFELLYER